MFKRVGLFLLTNFLVIATICIITTLLGFHGYLAAYGFDYFALGFLCLLWGSVGAFISLFLAKSIALRFLGVVIIDPATAPPQERSLILMIQGLARKAGLAKIPEVGIYESTEVNAFATGSSKKNSLIAVSTGLLAHMKEVEIQGVLGHEISHIANGDMVTMILIQGIVNSFGLFLSSLIMYGWNKISRFWSKDSSYSSTVIFNALGFIFDVFFTLLGSLLTAAFSRQREYRADIGGALIVGKSKMIAALQRLKTSKEDEANFAPIVQSLKINHKASVIEYFSSHPTLEDRIQRLQHLSFD